MAVLNKALILQVAAAASPPLSLVTYWKRWAHDARKDRRREKESLAFMDEIRVILHIKVPSGDTRIQTHC